MSHKPLELFIPKGPVYNRVYIYNQRKRDRDCEREPGFVYVFRKQHVQPMTH